jgi:hypothetical protein
MYNISEKWNVVCKKILLGSHSSPHSQNPTAAAADHRAGRPSGMPVVFIHCPYSNPHPPQMGRVWVENNYPLKK